MTEDVERKDDGPETYPLQMGHLPPQFLKKAERELFETPTLKKIRIEQMRDLLKKEETIKDAWFTDEVITMFLRWRKYDLQRSFTSVKKLVTFIRTYPQYFRPTDPDTVQKIFESEVISLMPYRTKDGCMIFIDRLEKWDPSEICLEDTVYSTFMLFMHLLEDPMTQVNGVIWVYDFQAPLLKYLRFCTPFTVYPLYRLFTECLPLRVVTANGINPNKVTKVVLPFLLSFASEKIRKKIKIHSELCTLTDVVQANVLPVEYGGQLTKTEWKRSWVQDLTMPSFVTAILDSQGLS